MRWWALMLLAVAVAGETQRHDWAREARLKMVELIANYSSQYRVSDPRVLAAMRKVPRHEFVPADLASYAYTDQALPIGEGQTISQPFIVGYMTQWLGLRPSDKVLEVGTGSGYQAAVLAELAREVYTIEILPTLAKRAEETLTRLGYRNVHVRTGDGYRGWPEAAPFDAVIVTCAPERIPPALVEQLKVGGSMMIPVGGELEGRPWAIQELVLVRRTPKGMERRRKMEVRFVPMTGETLRKTP